jgi:ABC-type transport system involved in cytochrome c biogenesis permease component
MRSLAHIYLVASKDLKLFARDRTALVFNLLFPFLFVALFGAVLARRQRGQAMELHIATQEEPTTSATSWREPS